MNLSQVPPGEYTITVALLSDPYQAQTTIMILAAPSLNCDVRVSTDKQNYTIGDAILINMTFINNGSEQISLYSTSYKLDIIGPSSTGYPPGTMGALGSVLSFIEERISTGPTNVSAHSEIPISTFTWDQKDITSGLQVPSGNYTITVTLTYDKYQGHTTITIREPA
jgi:hypothetical protein